MKKPPPKSSKPITTTAEFKKSNQDIWIGGLLALIAFLLYCNTLNHGYVMDDFAVISGNKFVQEGLKGIPNIFKSSYWFGLNQMTVSNYRPLSLMMFAIEWQLSPNNPSLSHWINVFLYSLTGLMLFFLIRKMTPNHNSLFALVVSLLWIIHPLHTEVVANIKSRDEILSFLFCIICLFHSINFIEKNKVIDIFYISCSYALALFSKENAICLTLIIPLSVYYFSSATKKQYTYLLIPIIICTILFFIARSLVLGHAYQQSSILLNDNSLVGAKSFIERYATNFYILGYYLYKFIIPTTFASDYSFNQIPLVSFNNPLALTSLSIYILLFYFALKNIKIKNWISYGILFFLLSIALVSNVFILISSTMGERFMYMPSLGLCIALTSLIINIFKVEIKNDPTSDNIGLLLRNSKFFVFTIFLISIFCSYKIITRNKDWKSDLSLFSKDVQTVTENVKMKYFYERAIMDELKYKKVDPAKQQTYLESALNQMKQAIKIDSNYYLLYNSTAEIYNFKKDYPKAIEFYKKGIAVSKGNVDAYGNLGNIYFRMQQYDSAVYYQSKAVSLNPNSYLSYNNLGGAQFQLQKYDDAVKSYQKAIQLNPSYTDAYKNLGTAYSLINKYDEAIQNYNKVLSLDPGNATVHYYLGLVYEKKGDQEKAAFYKNKAKSLDPSVK
jgi:Tfp pilus assembly protein PilF